MESNVSVIIQGLSSHPVNPKVKEKIKLRRRRSIVREFSLNTSTQGIPSIARSESVQNRIFWSIAFLIFAGVMIYFITQAIVVYFQYPTQTTVSITSERQQYFPALTVCSGSAVRYDTFVGPFTNFLNSLNLTNISDENSFSPIEAQLMRSYLPMVINRGESIDQFMYTLDLLLMDCQFGEASCSAKDFISFYSSAYGRCFTFNAKTKNGSLRYSYMSSEVTLLTLRLFLYSYQYVPYMSEGVAMMAMVHDNTQLPLIERAGMALAPGFKHRLTYTKKSVNSLPSPYSSCTDDIPLAMKIMFDEYEGADYAYSEDICYILCAQAYIYDQCGCVFPGQWNARSIVLPGSNTIVKAPLCNETDTCFWVAMNTFDSTPSIHDQYCSYCSQQCSITNFIVKPSLAISPPEWLMGSIKAFVENSSIPLPIDWKSKWPEYIRASYVSIDLMGESTLVENYTEIPSLQIVDLISNVGGQTGLWIGISFLSLMEVIEMLYRLIRYHIYLVRRAAKRDPRETPKPNHDVDSVGVEVSKN